MSNSKPTNTVVNLLKTPWTTSFNIGPCPILKGLHISLHTGPHA